MTQKMDLTAAAGTAWRDFEACRSTVLQSDVALVGDINGYQQEHGGKHLRPLLVLLSAGASDNPSPHTARLATVVELLHSASLMHDDVVDGDDMRRGVPSVQRRWNIRVALLAGDYYLARMMQLLNEVNDTTISQTVVSTAASMAEGELLRQQLLLEGQRCDTDTYLRIIDHKTARLMQTCCELGANREDKTVAERLRQFGHAYGMAFQLRDDIDDRNREQSPWIPDSDTLERELRTHCTQARDALQALAPSEQRDALIQLTKNLEI